MSDLKPSDINHLFFLLGCARAGKNTFAKHWQREISNTPRVVVTGDTIRLALTGQRYNKHAESSVFYHKYLMVKTHLLDGMEVLINGSNTTRRSLFDILSIDIRAQPIVIDTPIDICIERAYKTNMSDLVPVIQRHHRQLRELLDYGLEKTLDEIRNEIKTRWEK